MSLIKQHPSPAHPAGQETEARRQLRVLRERELVTQARADIDAGLGTEWADVEAWLYQMDADEALATLPPGTGQPQSRR